MLTTSAGAVNLTGTNTTTTIQPGTTGTAGTYTLTLSNEIIHLTDIAVYQLPFPVTVSPTNLTATAGTNETVNRTINATATVPYDQQPGTYTGEFAFLFDNHSTMRHAVNITVPVHRNFTVTNVSTQSNISIKSNPNVASIVVENTGNQNTTIAVNVTGNISDYLTYNPEITVFPGLQTTIRFGAGIPADTPFGRYTGQVQLMGDSVNRTVNISTRFVDTIAPTISSVEAPSFQATKPEMFTVEARDNLNVTRVNASVRYETTVMENNESVTVNKTLEELTYTREPKTNRWTVTPPADQRGTYYLDGVVADASGNTDTFAETFTVTGLNATRVLTNFSMPDYRTDTDAVVEIGELERDTPLTIRLVSFDQPLTATNETWRVGLITPDSGRRTFTDIGDDIVIDEAGAIKLFVNGPVAEDYYGELSLSGVQQHVPINNFTFHGSFSAVPVPHDQMFQVYDTNHTCSGVNAEQVTDAGWECTYFIPVSTVPADSSLKNELQAVTPKSAEQQTEQWQSRLQGKHGQFMASLSVNGVQLLVIVLLLYAVYYMAVIGPYRYSVPLEDTQD